jgi:transposase
MRYALSEAEWKIIRPILPSKPRGACLLVVRFTADAVRDRLCA